MTEKIPSSEPTPERREAELRALLEETERKATDLLHLMLDRLMPALRASPHEAMRLLHDPQYKNKWTSDDMHEIMGVANEGAEGEAIQKLNTLKATIDKLEQELKRSGGDE